MKIEEKIMLISSLRIIIDRFSFIEVEVKKLSESICHLARDLDGLEQDIDKKVKIDESNI